LNADFVALLEENNQSLHQLRASIYLAFKRKYLFKYGQEQNTIELKSMQKL
jgi:hypothetical protein